MAGALMALVQAIFVLLGGLSAYVLVLGMGPRP